MNHLVFSFPILNFARRTIAPALLLGCALYVLAQLGAPPQTVRAAGVYTGTVFRDYNANGAQDSREPGVGGVRVTFYDSSNTVPQNNGFIDTFAVVCAAAGVPAGTDAYGRSCTGPGTPALGSWSLTPSGTASTGPFRVEFTNVPGYLQPGANPSGLNQSQTTVQFAADGGATVNLGLNDPAQYVSSTNPILATPVLVQGAYNGTNTASSAAVSFPYNNTGTTAPISIATHGNIGAAWGIAFAPTSSTQGTLYVSAFQKRMADFGPSGSGAIYKIPVNPTTGAQTAAPSLFATVSGASGGHLFTNCSPATTGACDGTGGAWTPTGVTPTSFVGKAGLGALVSNDAFTTLYTVNLATKHLFSITVPGATVSDIAAVPHPTCNNGTDRPFGLGFHDGKLYMGGVCDASNGGTSADLSAYVYEWDPTTAFASASLVLSFPLNYTRTCANFSYSAPLYTSPIPSCLASPATLGPLAIWNPWTDSINAAMKSTTFQNNGATALGGSYPMPMLTKITFDNTDMIIGLRDRFGDMLGNLDPGPDGANPITNGGTNVNQQEVPAGDILRANPCPTASTTCTALSSGGWVLELNAASNPTGIFGATEGANNGQGPSSGEFYCEEWMLRHHTETSFGGLLQVPGFDNAALTAADAFDNAFTGGVIQLSNTNGDCQAQTNPVPGTHGAQRVRSYQVYASGSGISGGGPNFQKSNGLGDLVALMAPAPIEIGNRVWNDTNGNGRQDAGESGISGVVVGLYDSGGTFIASVTTDSNGNFLFSSASGTDVTGKNYGLSISPATQYTIAVFNTNFNSGQALFSTPYRTTANFDGQTNNNAFTDIRDSDGINLPSNVGNSGAGTLASIGVTLATSVITGAGYNNDSVDFGFRSTPTAASLVAFRARSAKEGVKVTWQTGSELQITGFNVWRQTGTGKWKHLNAEIISAKHMGGIRGAAYRFRDKSANTGKVYRYKLEILNASGEPEWSDVVKVR